VFAGCEYPAQPVFEFLLGFSVSRFDSIAVSSILQISIEKAARIPALYRHGLLLKSGFLSSLFQERKI
jgi:hypothetical protein